MADPEVLNAAERIDLFAGVVLSEGDQSVQYVTPERILRSEIYGEFTLKVSGAVKHFKEHDEYGTIRFLQQNGAIAAAVWTPHLYAFEPINSDTNLPEIIDRERCSFALSLRRVAEGSMPTPYPREIAIHSSQGIFAAAPNLGESSPGEDKYTEFHWFGHTAIAQHVTWPDGPDKHQQPLDFRTRKPWANSFGHQAFGDIWVPVDELRRGITAQVEFVMFQ